MYYTYSNFDVSLKKHQQTKTSSEYLIIIFYWKTTQINYFCAVYQLIKDQNLKEFQNHFAAAPPIDQPLHVFFS